MIGVQIGVAVSDSKRQFQFITEARFLGFPLHYWLIAQGCTIGYVLLCKLYCILWDARVRR